MNDKIQPGRYPARATGVASVYENAKGSLVLAMEFFVEGQTLKWLTTLATEDNGINIKTVERLKQCFGWDGQDFFWFVENPESYIERDVEVTVEHRQGDKATFVNIVFVDPPGGSGSLPTSGNKASLLAKYGSKLRAISGGAPAKTAPPAVKPPVKAPPAKPPAQPTLPFKPAAPDIKGTASNQMAVWARFAEGHEGKSEEEISSLWFAMLGEHFPGIDQGDLTPMQWGHLFEVLDQIPF
jgi:hypothetical protein